MCIKKMTSVLPGFLMLFFFNVIVVEPREMNMVCVDYDRVFNLSSVSFQQTRHLAAVKDFYIIKNKMMQSVGNERHRLLHSGESINNTLDLLNLLNMERILARHVSYEIIKKEIDDFKESNHINLVLNKDTTPYCQSGEDISQSIIHRLENKVVPYEKPGISLP